MRRTRRTLIIVTPPAEPSSYPYLNALRHRALSAFMRSVLENMLVTIAMLILCICLISDSRAGGESLASRINVPQGSVYVLHLIRVKCCCQVGCIPVLFECLIHMFSIVSEHFRFFRSACIVLSGICHSAFRNMICGRLIMCVIHF